MARSYKLIIKQFHRDIAAIRELNIGFVEFIHLKDDQMH